LFQDEDPVADGSDDDFVWDKKNYIHCI
jgi:hypothetical protein